MGTKWSPEEKRLYKRIDEILRDDWNPIGFDGLPKDEYTSFVSKIYALKKSLAFGETIAQEFFRIETTYIGLSGDIEKCRLVGAIIEKL
jgi:hypothetical protein